MSNKKEREEKVGQNGKGSRISRRSFLKGVGTGAISAAVAPTVLEAAEKASKVAASGEAQIIKKDQMLPISLKVNGKVHKVEVEPRRTLLSVLRSELDLTGAKPICEKGECGGCTVIVNGKPIYSCMALAIDVQGKEVTTVEGLAKGDKLHPVQEAFIEHDALMCGFCTPGFVVATKALLDKHPNPTLGQIKEELSGNICRCGTYPRIFEAAMTASAKMRKGA